MTGHLYWASANYEIAADIELPHEIRMVATGDFSGPGSAVLRGALSRVTRLPFPVRVDASGITALSTDAAAALAERAGDPAGRLIVESASSAAAPILNAAQVHVTPMRATATRATTRHHRPRLRAHRRPAPGLG